MYAVRMRAAGRTLTGRELTDEIRNAGPDVQLYVSVGTDGVLCPVNAVEMIGHCEAHLVIETDVWERLDQLTKFVERVATGDMTREAMFTEADELIGD